MTKVEAPSVEGGTGGLSFLEAELFGDDALVE
jgi:hypothetical protein